MKTVALITAALITAGCATTTNGDPRTATPGAAGPRPSTVAPVPTGPPIVPAASIKGKLLKRSDLGDIVGDTNLVAVANYTDPDRNADAFDPVNCGDRFLAASSVGYNAPGRMAMYGDGNRGSRGMLASQVIVAFPDVERSQQFMETTTDGWLRCPNDAPFTITDPGSAATVQTWIADVPLITPTRIATTLTRQGGPPRTCSHVIAIVSNVAVEGAACGDGDTAAQAGNITDRILAELP